jgi:hypothetical protein
LLPTPSLYSRAVVGWCGTVPTPLLPHPTPVVPVAVSSGSRRGWMGWRLRPRAWEGWRCELRIEGTHRKQSCAGNAGVTRDRKKMKMGLNWVGVSKTKAGSNGVVFSVDGNIYHRAHRGHKGLHGAVLEHGNYSNSRKDAKAQRTEKRGPRTVQFGMCTVVQFFTREK